MTPQDKLVSWIISAFNNVPMPASMPADALTSDELMDYLDEMAVMEPNEVQWILPKIMVSFLEDDSWDPFDILRLISDINLSESTLDSLKRELPELSAEFFGIICGAADNWTYRLSFITDGQADAILAWLRYIAEMDYFKVTAGLVQGAIDYWDKRAGYRNGDVPR